MYVLGLVRIFFFAVSLAQDWPIHLKLVLFSLGSNGRKVVCNSGMENTYLKLHFNPPKPLQSKPGEKAAYPNDFVENWRWRAIFSYAYNIPGATKLLIIECRLGGGEVFTTLSCQSDKKQPWGGARSVHLHTFNIFSRLLLLSTVTDLHQHFHIITFSEEHSLNFCLV